MRTMSIRALRQETPRLKQTLAEAGEVLLVSNGEPIARLLPVETAPRRRLPSLKAFRDAQPGGGTSIQELIRRERDSR